jgi:hypothetical protein
MTLWCESRSGSADPCLSRIRILLFSLMTFKGPTKNSFFQIFCLLLFEGIFTPFFKRYKVQKKSQNSKNQSFSYYFCLMIEGLGAGFRSGSIPLTSGSGSRSGRPNNIWIRWIRIRIRIQNTGFK